MIFIDFVRHDRYGWLGVSGVLELALAWRKWEGFYFALGGIDRYPFFFKNIPRSTQILEVLIHYVYMETDKWVSCYGSRFERMSS